MLHVALALAALTAPVTTAPPTMTPTIPTIEDRVVTFFDGAAWRRIERLDGSTVRYVDVDTGRSTIATLDDTALLQVADGADVDDVVARHGLQIVRPAMPSIGLYVVRALAGDDGAVTTARVQQRRDVDVAAVFPNLGLRHTTMTTAADAGLAVPPNDPRYAGQFYLDDVGIEGAWVLEVGAPDVVVAIVDNGCDTAHPDLVDKLLPGHDVITDDEDPSHTPNADGNNHGTACAGLVAASTDNDTDIAGTCPLCALTCTRLLSARGEPVPLDADVRAFDHAFVDDVAVVSNSWGFIDAIPVPQVLKAAIIQVQQNGRGGKGAVVVFASGNDNREVGDDELLAVPGVLGVGAVNNLGELTQFSNRGRSVDVVAPTGTVATDISGPGGDSDGDVTFRFGGTSSACPIVAGIAGLIVARAPELTADEVTSLLEQTARQSIFARPDADGHDLEYGFGLVQPAAALAATSTPEPQPEPEPEPEQPEQPEQPDDDDDVALGGGGCGSCSDAGAAVALPVLPALGRWRRRRRRPA